MKENDPQNPNTSPSHVESNPPEEGSNPDAEPDQRRQDVHMQHVLRDEKIRCVCIGVAVFAIILSATLFLFTKSIIPLFVTIVGVPLLYRYVDVYLDTSEASVH
jgi:hypothetical protein